MHVDLCLTALFFPLVYLLITITGLFYYSYNTINPGIRESWPVWGFCLLKRQLGLAAVALVPALSWNNFLEECDLDQFHTFKRHERTNLQYGITQIKLSGMELSCGILPSLRCAAIEAVSIKPTPTSPFVLALFSLCGESQAPSAGVWYVFLLTYTHTLSCRGMRPIFGPLKSSRLPASF